LLLRQDNADIRLTALSNKLGLANNERLAKVNQKIEGYTKIIDFFKNTSAEPEVINPFLQSVGSAEINQKWRYFNVISRPNISVNELQKVDSVLSNFLSAYDNETIEQAEILMKYEGYIEREKENADKQKRLEDYKISDTFDYNSIKSLGAEAIEKFKKFKPETIGQASRISGINPADISVLLVYLGR
jgi:tRNA uridine 5-carboxymethylaminomethyl modification enzyme